MPKKIGRPRKVRLTHLDLIKAFFDTEEKYAKRGRAEDKDRKDVAGNDVNAVRFGLFGAIQKIFFEYEEWYYSDERLILKEVLIEKVGDGDFSRFSMKYSYDKLIEMLDIAIERYSNI